jgi:cell division protein FtsI (penicillin-binding protein 3)
MTAAMNAVANGGTWLEPRIVRAAVRDGVRTPITPKVTRRAISPETVAQLIPILESVVVDGTGKKAQVAGYTVAGKTGTADKIINGRYSGSQQNVSFLGFVPSRNPALTIIVMVDTPRVGSDTGGFVAAPIFQRIAEASLRYLGVAPNIDAPPPIVVARRDESPVVATLAANAHHEPTIVTLPGGGEAPVLPDLRGLSARDALRTLAKLGLTARLEGRGVVTGQTPLPGTLLERGGTCTLVLEREPARPTLPAGAGQ